MPISVARTPSVSTRWTTSSQRVAGSRLGSSSCLLAPSVRGYDDLYDIAYRRHRAPRLRGSGLSSKAAPLVCAAWCSRRRPPLARSAAARAKGLPHTPGGHSRLQRDRHRLPRAVRRPRSYPSRSRAPRSEHLCSCSSSTRSTTSRSTPSRRTCSYDSSPSPTPVTNRGYLKNANRPVAKDPRRRAHYRRADRPPRRHPRRGTRPHGQSAI